MRNIRFALLLAATLALSRPTTTQAQDSATPNYDIAGYCEQVSQAIGGSYQIKDQCMKDERASLVAVRSLASVESRITRYCDEVATAIGGSYQIYERCLKDEIEAKNAVE